MWRGFLHHEISLKDMRAYPRGSACPSPAVGRARQYVRPIAFGRRMAYEKKAIFVTEIMPHELGIFIRRKRHTIRRAVLLPDLPDGMVLAESELDRRPQDRGQDAR